MLAQSRSQHPACNILSAVMARRECLKRQLPNKQLSAAPMLGSSPSSLDCQHQLNSKTPLW